MYPTRKRVRDRAGGKFVIKLYAMIRAKIKYRFRANQINRYEISDIIITGYLCEFHKFSVLFQFCINYSTSFGARRTLIIVIDIGCI